MMQHTDGAVCYLEREVETTRIVLNVLRLLLVFLPVFLGAAVTRAPEKGHPLSGARGMPLSERGGA